MRLQLFHAETLREVLHKEVALLLGVLESLLLSQNNNLSLISSQSWLNIKLEAFNFLVIEFNDGFLGRDEASFFVVGVIEAYEGELALNELRLADVLGLNLNLLLL